MISLKEKREEDGDESIVARLVEQKSYGAAIKAVTDRGWQDSYEEALDAEVAKKDAQIQNACEDSYEQFLGGVDSLIDVKRSTAELKKQIQELDNKVQESGSDLVKKTEALISARQRALNMTTASEHLRSCQRLVALASKAQKQIEKRKYFSALKTCDDLTQL